MTARWLLEERDERHGESHLAAGVTAGAGRDGFGRFALVFGLGFDVELHDILYLHDNNKYFLVPNDTMSRG